MKDALRARVVPARPPTLDAPVDLLVRQLPDPPPALGGRATLEELGRLHLALPDPPAEG